MSVIARYLSGAILAQIIRAKLNASFDCCHNFRAVLDRFMGETHSSDDRSGDEECGLGSVLSHGLGF